MNIKLCFLFVVFFSIPSFLFSANEAERILDIQQRQIVIGTTGNGVINIEKYVVSNKNSQSIKKEIKDSMDKLINTETSNIKKIDPWKYKDYLKNQAERLEMKNKRR